MPLDVQAVYRVRSDARSIAERARMIALEHNVETPLEAIDDPFVHNEIVGRVLEMKDIGAKHRGGGVFYARVALATTQHLLAGPAKTWHQFRAIGEGPLGFLCMVNAVRDKPQLPTPEEPVEFEQYPRIADFLDGVR